VVIHGFLGNSEASRYMLDGVGKSGVTCGNTTPRDLPNIRATCGFLRSQVPGTAKFGHLRRR
jgi:hypothetical protein